MLANSRRSHNGAGLTGEGSGAPDPSLSSSQVLVAGGVLAPIIFTVLSLLDSLLQPGYNLLTGYVSDLSWMSDGWMTVASFIISGWLVIGFSVALCRLADAGGSLALASVLVWRDHRRDGQSIRAACVYLVMGLACVGLFAASLMLPSAALPGLLERVALLIGAAWIAGFALGAFPQRPCWSPPS